MPNQRTIVVSSTFPADVDKIWPKLLQLDTLRYISWPLMSFSPFTGVPEAQWNEGMQYAFRLRMFGLLPFGGRHEIRLARIDKAALEIQSYESNQIVNTWNHHIKLARLTDGNTRYTDTVQIGAGWCTPAIARWARLFYHHRQRRWCKLLRNDSHRKG